MSKHVERFLWIFTPGGAIVSPEAIQYNADGSAKGKESHLYIKGCSIAEIRSGIQECIDAAWDQVWTPGNIQAQVKWQRMFPGCKKPSIDEFIIVITKGIVNSKHVHAAGRTTNI